MTKSALIMILALCVAGCGDAAPSAYVPTPSPCPSAVPESKMVQDLQNRVTALQTNVTDLQTVIMEKNKTINNLLIPGNPATRTKAR